MGERRKYIEGFGSIFRKSFKRRRADGSEYEYISPTWHIAYYHNGQELRESSDSKKEKAAIKLLKRRVQDLGRGVIGTREDRVTFEQLVEDLKNDYKVNGKRSLSSVELSVSHLEEFFAGDRAVHITTDRIRAYIAKRQEEKAANGSINRELSALKRAFSLAQQAGKLFHRPYVPMLEENNARQGFLEHGDFLRLREELPGYLKDPVSFLYFSGWRVSEMRSLEWRDVSQDAVRLRAENNKNKEQRVLPLRGELAEIMERARRNRQPDCYHVFHVDGQPIGDFRKSWQAACVAAGLGRFLEEKQRADGEIEAEPTTEADAKQAEEKPQRKSDWKKYRGLIVHDMRRSAVRNMIKAGIPEKIAMGLSGHKTRSVFDRYHIVSEDDLAAASERLLGYLEQQAEAAKIIPLRQVSSSK